LTDAELTHPCLTSYSSRATTDAVIIEADIPAHAFTVKAPASLRPQLTCPGLAKLQLPRRPFQGVKDGRLD
jgi:hypothetical protein